MFDGTSSTLREIIESNGGFGFEGVNVIVAIQELSNTFQRMKCHIIASDVWAKHSRGLFA